MSQYEGKSAGLESESIVYSREITQRARKCYRFGLGTIESHISDEISNGR